jgi:hypothetical protein
MPVEVRTLRGIGWSGLDVARLTWFLGSWR